jgi:WD40 repeat protein
LRASTLAELGGAARIVEEHLERALAGLDADQLDLAASLFNHLVTPSGTKIAHGVADLAGYTNATPGSLGPLLSSLSSARIVRRLAGRAGGPPRYEIFHDVLAGAVLTWRDRFETERAVSREREQARARQRRLLALVGAAALALCLVGALAAYALVQRADARDRAEEAKARELTVSAVSVLGKDPELAMLLALEAVDREPSRAAESALRAGLLRSRVLASVSYGTPVVAAVPSGGGVLGATSDGVVHRRDGTTVQVAQRLTQGAFSPSRQLLVGGAGTDVGVWDVGSGARRTAFSLPAPLVRVATDGRTFAAAAADGTLVIRRLAGSGATRITLRERPTALAVRGHVIAAASGRVVRIFDDRGRAISTWPEERATILGLAIAPRSAELVTTAADSGVRVRRVPDGTLLNVMLGHLDLVTGATYVPDGTRLVTIGGDRRARLWEPSTGRLFALLAGHASEIRTVATSTDGRRIATGDLGGTVKISDANGDPILRLVARLDSEPVAVRWSGTGPVAVTSGADPRVDGRARVEGAEVHLPGGVVLRGHDGRVTSVRYSADGARVITASDDRDARIWDPRTGASLVTLSGHFGRVSDASFSRDGRWAVTAGPASAGIWDASTGELLSYLRGHEGPVVSAIFAPDSRTVLTAGTDRTVRSWRCAYCGPLDELVRQARAKLRAIHRNLTPAERAANGL